MKFYICAFIKDSHWYLDEWIRHHLDIGFDEIFLVEDIDSKPHNEITDKYQQVTLTKFEDYLPNSNYLSGIERQKRIYNKFCFEHKEGWCAFIDDDEFIQLTPNTTLTDIAERYSGIHNVLMNWIMYGANHHIKRVDNVQDSYTYAKSNNTYIDIRRCRWKFKTFLNLSYKFNTFNCVHLAKDDEISNYSKQKYKQYIKDNEFESYICLKHYITKSWEDWMWKICKRGNPTQGLRKLTDFFDRNIDMIFAYDLLMSEQDYDKVDFEMLQIEYDKIRDAMDTHAVANNNYTEMMLYDKYKSEKFIDNWKRFCIDKKPALQEAFPDKNIDNPQTLAEKVQWLKIYDVTPLKAYCTDKITVRNYCVEKLGVDICVPLIGVFDKPEEIDWNVLPNRFVIKCNHGCHMNIIVDDKDVVDIDDINMKLNEWLKIDYGTQSYQFHYSLIMPKILIEEYMEDHKDTSNLTDYKFMCFNGQVRYLYIVSNRNNENIKLNFYDTDFNPLTDVCSKSCASNYDVLDKKPVNFDLMKEYATKLSKDFKLVRVDFYEIDGKLYLGELTFTPGNGKMDYTDSAINTRFGGMLQL